MADQAAFLARDHDLGLDTAGHIGYEILREADRLGIPLEFKFSGGSRFGADYLAQLAPYRCEVLMIWLGRELYGQAEAWAKLCFDRGAKKFSHDEERYYYGLKARAAGLLPKGTSTSQLGLGGESWDPSLSSAYGPDGAFVMDVKRWPRKCAKGCGECARTLGPYAPQQLFPVAEP